VADRKSEQPFASEENFASRVGTECAKRGLLVYPMQGCVDGISGDHVLIAPPAVIAKEEIVWAVSQLSAAIQQAASSAY
jgi:adenosylmethionine-8-amino-7-oxononanoate aminotransferase